MNQSDIFAMMKKRDKLNNSALAQLETSQGSQRKYVTQPSSSSNREVN